MENENDNIQTLTESAPTIREVIESITGTNDKGQAKAAASVISMYFDMNKEIQREIGKAAESNAEVQIFGRTPEYVQVNLIFPLPDDMEMVSFYQILDNYNRKMNENDDENILILCSVTISPAKYEGKVTLTLDNPIFWGIQALKPGMRGNIISMLFKTENAELNYVPDFNLGIIAEAEQRMNDETDRINSLAIEDTDKAEAERFKSNIGADGFEYKPTDALHNTYTAREAEEERRKQIFRHSES